MTPSPRALAARVRRLADTLQDLGHRVRRAVAAETGAAVAAAVRDLLTELLRGPDDAPDPVPRAYDRPAPVRPHPGYGPDDWDEDAAAEDWHGDDLPAPLPAPAPAAWPVAVAVIAAAARGWAARRSPAWAAVGVGLLATAVGTGSGPLAESVRAALGAVTALAPHLFPAH